MSALTDERRALALNQVFAKGRVTIRGLAETLDVSEATVRRDLQQLARDGQLELVHGGATVARTSDYSFRSKQVRNREAKRAIGRLAAGLVSDSDQIFLDSGTTCFEMAPHLRKRRALSVITNSTRLAMELDAPGVTVIMPGGQYRAERMDTVGPVAMRTLENLRGYLAFIGSDGMSEDFGVAASDIESAHLHALAVHNARETILVADHSKFLSPSLYRIVGFAAISRIVTDRRPPAEWMRFFDGRGIETLYPEKSNDPS